MPMMFFYFLKIIFDINTSKRSKKYKPHSILAKKKKKFKFSQNTGRNALPNAPLVGDWSKKSLIQKLSVYLVLWCIIFFKVLFSLKCIKIIYFLDFFRFLISTHKTQQKAHKKYKLI
jgi:hypothetical protein